MCYRLVRRHICGHRIAGGYENCFYYNDRRDRSGGHCCSNVEEKLLSFFMTNCPNCVRRERENSKKEAEGKK